MSSKQLERLVLASFFLSGLAALLYEVCWIRLAGLYFESTVQSIATVVGIFMGGLALGSRLAGKVAGLRRDRLLLYFTLEGLIGVCAVAVPWAFRLWRPVFGAVYRGLYDAPVPYHAAHLLISAAILLPATTLMGLTLPILVQALSREHHEIGAKSGLLYGVNCAGAAVGAMVCGFLLLPALGILRTTLVGAAVNLALGALGWTVLRRSPAAAASAAAAATGGAAAGPGGGSAGGAGSAGTGAATAKRPRPPEPKREAAAPRRASGARAPHEAGSPAAGIGPVVLVAFALSGFCGLCYQIIWTRILISNLAPASHSFAIIVSCFILGLALGGGAYAVLSRRLRDAGYVSGVLMLLAGLTATATTLLLPRLPGLAARVLSGASASFGAVSVARYALAAAIVLPLTVFSGALFPAAAAAYARGMDHLAGRIGRLYAANGLGSIVGSLLAGFVLLPWLGAQRAGLPVTALQFAAGLAVVYRSRGLRPLAAWAALPAVAIAALLVSPQADPKSLFGGSYIYFDLYRNPGGAHAQQVLLYHKDGPSGTVTVMRHRRDPHTVFAMDGKTDGSSDGLDMTTQTRIADLPLLLHPDPHEALIIGLGTGTSFAQSLHHPLRRSTCVEISPQVVEASHFFDAFLGGDPLRDPRARLRVGDGRSMVFFGRERYDVIIAQPSNPWMSGTGNLFTREFFEAGRRQLLPGGVYCQWLHGYRMKPGTFRDIVHTFTAVFPHVSLWWVGWTNGDFIMLGTEGSQRFDLDRLAREIPERQVRTYMQRPRLLEPMEFLRDFVAADAGLRAWSASAHMLTDDNARLEDTASREMYVDAMPELRAELVRIAQPATIMLDPTDAARPDVAERLAVLQRDRAEYLEDYGRRLDPTRWITEFTRSDHAAWRGDPAVVVAVASWVAQGGSMAYDEALRQRDPARRGELLRRAAEVQTAACSIDPGDPLRRAELALTQRALGDSAGCARTIVTAEQNGLVCGRLLQARGELANDLAVAAAQQAQQLAQRGAAADAQSRHQAALTHLHEAETAFREATELEGQNPVHWQNLAIAEFNLGDRGAAREHARRALQIDPEYSDAASLLARIGP